MDAPTPLDTPAARIPIDVPSPRPRSRWDAWGTSSSPLPTGAKSLIRIVLPGKAHAVPRITAPTLEPSTLDSGDLSAFIEIVGVSNATCDDADRILHLGGKSTPDLLARRSPRTQTAPDAVVSPASHDEIVAILRLCTERGIAVVPFGGGTSVVGGVHPDRGRFAHVIAMDLARTAALWELDETSLLATFGAGTTGPQAEEMLAARGYTLGHFPQSFEYASLGGYAATRSSGQASRGYGRFDDVVHGLRVATPIGDLDLGRAPASAAGPDLRQLFLGSEGAFGVISEVTVRVRPTPTVTLHRSWTFPDFAAGAAAVRELTQRGIRPTVLRLSDESETRVNAVMGGHLTRMRGCLAIATFEGTGRISTDDAEIPADITEGIFAAHGAKSRGEEPARSWERGRFASPALRDTLLDIGVLAETLETASTWSKLQDVKSAVTDALTTSLTADGAAPIVMCHISHVYPAGASLYFTVVAALATDPAPQWRRAKDAASRAIGETGATITHHHAVGRDHLPYLEQEIGGVGAAVLRAVKDALDPRGVMNPGVLVPRAGSDER